MRTSKRRVAVIALTVLVLVFAGLAALLDHWLPYMLLSHWMVSA